MVDRLMHNAEIVAIDGDSYRVKEARERAEQRAQQRKAAKKKIQGGSRGETQP